MERLKDSHVITHTCKIACAGKACRAGTDDRDLVAVLFSRRFRFDSLFSCAVCNKTLEFSDRNSFAFDAADTFSFALCLLRTYTAADSGKRAGFADDLIRLLKIAFFHFMNEGRDIDRNRTSGHTFGIFTIKAAACFCHGLFLIISEAHLVKIGRPYFGILFSDGNLL